MPAPQIISKSPARHVSPQKVRLAVVKRGDALSEAFRLIGAAVRFERNTEIHGEDEPAEYFYQVESGAVRTYRLRSDGRRGGRGDALLVPLREATRSLCFGLLSAALTPPRTLRRRS